MQKATEAQSFLYVSDDLNQKVGVFNKVIQRSGKRRETSRAHRLPESCRWKKIDLCAHWKPLELPNVDTKNC